MVFRRDKNPGWTENELQELSLRIEKFNACAHHVISEYQPSRLGTIEFHFLHHPCDDLRATGHIDYLHAGLYGATNNQSKETHRSTSKRQGSAMREVLKIHGFRTKDEFPQRKYVMKRSNRKTTHQENKAIKPNGMFSVKNEPFASFLKLERARKAVHEAGALEDWQMTVGIPQYVKWLAISHGAEALAKLLNLLLKMF